MSRHGLSGIFPVSTPLLVSSVYYVVRQHDPELLSLINEGLHELINDGTYDRIYRTWFVAELTQDEIDRMFERGEALSLPLR